MMLSMVLHEPHYYGELLNVIPEPEFRADRTKRLFLALSEFHASQAEASDFVLTRFLHRLKDEPLKTFATELAMTEWDPEKRERVFRDCLDKMRQVEFEDDLRSLRSRIRRAEVTGDQDQVRSLMKVYQEMLASKSSKAEP
jgi:hypothetical protein